MTKSHKKRHTVFAHTDALHKSSCTDNQQLEEQKQSLNSQYPYHFVQMGALDLSLKVSKCFLFHFEEFNFLIIVDTSNKLFCYRIRAVYKTLNDSLNMYSTVKVDKFLIARLYDKENQNVTDIDCYGNHLIIGHEKTVEMVDKLSGIIQMECILQHTLDRVIVPRLKWSGRDIDSKLVFKVSQIIAVGCSDQQIDISLIKVTQ